MKDYQIPNFNIAWFTSENRGLLVYVHNSIKFKVLNQQIKKELNNCWLEFELNHKTAIYGLFYRSPSQDAAERAQYMQTLKANIKSILTLNSELVLINADFNARNTLFWEQDITNQPGRELYDIFFLTIFIYYHIIMILFLS